MHEQDEQIDLFTQTTYAHHREGYPTVELVREKMAGISGASRGLSGKLRARCALVATLLIAAHVVNYPVYADSPSTEGTPVGDASPAAPALRPAKHLPRAKSLKKKKIKPVDPSSGVSLPFADEKDELRTMGKDTAAKLQQLEELADETTKSSGAIFVSPEKVLVKQPMLTALISLDRRMPSPYGLESLSQREMGLREVLQTARQNNLDIKIVHSDMDAKKWQYIGAFGGFLPSLANDYQMQAITGQYVTATGLALPIRNLYLTSNNSVQQYLFKGGSILHTFLEDKHKYIASKWGLRGTISDILRDAAELYYNLVLEDVLLQIRVKAVEVSQGLVIINKDMFEDGVNTELDVLQAEYELSKDRQELIEQQIKRRKAAVRLATALNLDPNQDLVVNDRLVGKIRLVDDALMVPDLVSVAVANRPELKRYEQLRLAAIEQIKVARATLLPTVATTGSVIGTSARASNLFSSATTGLSPSGAGVGAVSPATLPLSGSSGSGPHHWDARSLFVLGLDMQWNIGGLGVTEIGQINSAKAEARKRQYEFNRALTEVYKEVHDHYLASMGAENRIVETTAAVKYAEQGLKVAQLRFTEGVGTYQDVIQAQRNYIAALVSKANSLVEFNVSQAKLVHAVGRVSVAALSTPDAIRRE